MPKHPRPEYAAPLLVAFVPLLLLVFYVSSYLALVRPSPGCMAMPFPYRLSGGWLDRAYWPLLKIDYHVRPHSWRPITPRIRVEDDGFERIGIDFN